MMLIIEVSSPPSMVRCRQLKITLYRKSNAPDIPMEGFRAVLLARRLAWTVDGLPPQVPPKACPFASSASLEIAQWLVTFSAGSFIWVLPSGDGGICQ